MKKILLTNMFLKAYVGKDKKGLFLKLFFEINDLKRTLNIFREGFKFEIAQYENQELNVKVDNNQLFLNDELLIEADEMIAEGTLLVLQNLAGTKYEGYAAVFLGKNPVQFVRLSDLPCGLFKNRNSFKVRMNKDQTWSIVRYANLHQHTSYSLLDGMVKLDELAKKAEDVVAITDHGNMSGALKFYNTMKAAEKTPIIGVEGYIETLTPIKKWSNAVDQYDLMFDSSDDDEDAGNKAKAMLNGEHLILLAKSNEGIKNLFKLTSLAETNKRKGKPHIKYEWLRQYKEGIVCTSACIGGTLGSAIKHRLKAVDEGVLQPLINRFGREFYNNPELNMDLVNDEMKYAISVYKTNMEAEKNFIITMKEMFGEDFYLELQNHHFELEDRIMKEIVEYSKQYGIKLTVGIDAHYLNKEDKETHEMWLCLQTKKTMSSPDRMRFSGDGYYVHNSDEVIKLFEGYEDALDNTLEIADKCKNINPNQEGYHLPEFPIPDGFKDDVDYFVHLCKMKYYDRFHGKPEYSDKTYLERMQFEIETIRKMGWCSYFLIVSDFIAYAKDDKVAEHLDTYFPKNRYNHEDIPDYIKKDYQVYIGAGRGSAAGSLVCYCLGITDLDPIKYDLLFERFLNPDRISMPDIDTDLEDSLREVVINYVKYKYGPDHVARIITFGTAAAKAAIKDAMRIMEKPLDLSQKVSDSIPKRPGITLLEALDESHEFAEFYADPEVKPIIDVALKFEGLQKSRGQHACFTADTKVITSEGEKNICDVKAGDKVLTHKSQYKKVVETFVREADQIVIIKTDDDTEVKCTSNHPFLMKNKNNQVKWVEASRIRKGMTLYKPNEYKWVHVVSTVKKAGKCNVYNLSVYDDNSYTANGLAVHNCGVLISPRPVTDYTPVAMLANTETGDIEPTAAFVAPECEDMGLLKMDFLGLRTLGVIHEAINNIKEKHGVDIDPNAIPLDDLNVYKAMEDGNTDAVFQVESPYMSGLIRQMYQDIPELEKSGMDSKAIALKMFDRLCDANALGRPGPMDEIPNYVENMLHPEKVHYDVPTMEEVLKPTNGIIVYQEQSMILTRILAGFTPGQADKVRKGMAKKVKSILDEYGDYFINGSKKLGIKGCVANGIDEEVARSIWQKMEKFGAYAFNKSHSVAYSLLTARTAWLSYYYPTEYMTAVLNSYISDIDRIKRYVNTAKDRSIQVLGPDINESAETFSSKGNVIRFGLMGIKGCGKSSQKIISERKERGNFESYQSFLVRMATHQNIDKRVIEALTFSGTLDSFKGTRKEKMDQLEPTLEYIANIKQIYNDTNKEIYKMFGIENPMLDKEIIKKTGERYSKDFVLNKELEYTSFYITGHPLDDYQGYIRGSDGVRIGDIIEAVEDDGSDGTVKTYNRAKANLNKEITIFAVITECEPKVSKTGNRYANLVLEDKTGKINGTAYKKVYARAEDMLIKGQVLELRGKVNKDDFGTSFNIYDVSPLEEDIKDKEIKEVHVNGDMNKLNNFLVRLPAGETEVYLGSQKGRKKYKITSQEVSRLQKLFGNQNINVKWD